MDEQASDPSPSSVPEPGSLEIKTSRVWPKWVFVGFVLGGTLGTYIGSLGGPENETSTTAPYTPPPPAKSGATTSTTTTTTASTSSTLAVGPVKPGATSTTAAIGPVEPGHGTATTSTIAPVKPRGPASTSTTTSTATTTTTSSTVTTTPGGTGILLPQVQKKGSWSSAAFSTGSGPWTIGWAYSCTRAVTGPPFQIYVVTSGTAPRAVVQADQLSGSGMTTETVAGQQILQIEADPYCVSTAGVTGTKP